MLKYSELIKTPEFAESKKLFRLWLEWQSNCRPGEFQKSMGKLLQWFEEGSLEEFVNEVLIEDD